MSKKPISRRLKSIAITILIISGLYVIAVAGWVATSNRMIMTMMEIITIWAAIVIVQLMVELHQSCDDPYKSSTLTALALTVCMAAITIANHFIYLTVLGPLYARSQMPDWLLLYGWPSLTKGLECVAWGFLLGLGMLFVSGALESFGGKALKWTMRGFGVLTLLGLIGPVVGNMAFYNFSTVGYSVGFLVISIELLVFTKRHNRPQE